MIALADVHKSFGANPVVKGIHLEVARGELVSLLGPSGCGKTTTLRIIAGLERPDRGVVHLDGAEVDGPGGYVPPEKRELGMVFQSYAIWPHRTVIENVAYPLGLRRVPRAERGSRAIEALRQVRLEALAERRPHQLSGGQLQRVALARALVAGPKVVLLDEPLSNVDATLREELRAEIAALRARIETTMVYVTHDQSEALALSDRVAVMNRGVIEQIDAPEHLYREPSTPFVAAFVGGANVLEGQVEGRTFLAGETRFALPDGLTASDGPATLVVRAEDLTLDRTGTPLPLTARLFLGHAVEYRLALGDLLLRSVGLPVDARPGARVGVRIRAARLFKLV
jgi:ABC-type Fe3+/spermidine/putrescine transport system ATPase subunit